MPNRPIAIAAFVLLLTLVAVVSLSRGSRLRYDFDHFYLDGRYLLEHGRLNPSLDHPDEMQRRRLPFYLPVVPMLIAPLTAAGPLPAAIAWTLLQVLSAAAAFRILFRWLGPESDRGVVIFTALALPAVFEAARFNQLSFPILALVLSAIASLERGRDLRAGALLAAAAVIKLLPAVFLLWLACKRRWAALAACLVAAGTLALLPPLILWGPAKARQYHVDWWHYNVAGVLGGGIQTAGPAAHFTDHRNQSLRSVLERLLGTGAAALSSNTASAPSSQTTAAPAANAARLATLVILAGLLAGLVWVSRRPWRDLPLAARGQDASLWLLAMLVFSPLLRQYYLIWALPALACCVASALKREQPGALTGMAPRAARVALALWVAGMALWPFEPARTAGVHLWMLIGIGIAIAARAAADQPPQHGQPGSAEHPAT